jgi:hypothetical protein
LGSKGLWLQTFVGPKDGGKKHFSSSNNDCGMLTFKDGEFKEGIRKETGLKPEWATESFSDIASDVRQSISRNKGFAFYPSHRCCQRFHLRCCLWTAGRSEVAIAFRTASQMN